MKSVSVDRVSWRATSIAAVSASLLFSTSCSSQSTGTVSGTYAGIKLDHIRAFQIRPDSCEANPAAAGTVDPNSVIRIFMGDQDLPLESLVSVDLDSAKALAASNHVRGFVVDIPLNFDQGGYDDVLLTTDDRTNPSSEIEIGQVMDQWRKVKFANGRATGDITLGKEHIKFDAPVTANPLVSQLTGQAAANSDIVRQLRQRWAALAKGDLAAVRATEVPNNPQISEKDANDPFTKDFFKNLTNIPVTFDCVMIREHTATVEFAGSAFNHFVRVDGKWKNVR